MKYIALAVLLAVMQAPPPVPRKAANPSGRTGNSVDQQRQDNKNPSTQPESGVQPVGAQPNQDGSQSKAADNANKSVIIRELPCVSVTKDRLDKLYIFFTGVLIVVGSFGVRAAYRTLKAIERQADLIGRQVTLMTGQLEAMKGQLAQMESAGNQTKALISHASQQVVALRQSADALKHNAKAQKIIALATQQAAKAGKKSADALINAERPWIVATLTRASRVTYGVGGTDYVLPELRFTLSFRNYGRTLAHIISVRTCPRVVKFIDDLPDRPEYLDGLPATFQSALMIVPRGVWKYDYTDVSIVMPEQWEDIKTGKQLFVYFGRIEYRDVFSPMVLHETRFCYAYRYRIDDLVIEGPREYTKYT